MQAFLGATYLALICTVALDAVLHTTTRQEKSEGSTFGCTFPHTQVGINVLSCALCYRTNAKRNKYLLRSPQCFPAAIDLLVDRLEKGPDGIQCRFKMVLAPGECPWVGDACGDGLGGRGGPTQMRAHTGHGALKRKRVFKAGMTSIALQSP